MSVKFCDTTLLYKCKVFTEKKDFTVWCNIPENILHNDKLISKYIKDRYECIKPIDVEVYMDETILA